jgi:hypothetical protein
MVVGMGNEGSRGHLNMGVLQSEGSGDRSSGVSKITILCRFGKDKVGGRQIYRVLTIFSCFFSPILVVS